MSLGPGFIVHRLTYAQLSGLGKSLGNGTPTSVFASSFPPGSYFLSSEILFSAVNSGTGARPLFSINFL